MCSTHGEDEIQSLIQKPKQNLVGSQCKKCETAPANIVLRGKDSYCRNCFLAIISHKFRATLGKSKLIKPNDKVLVAFSGSQSSVALVHLIQAGVSEASHKKLLFEPCVLYVDEGAALGLSSQERKATISEIAKILNGFGISSYVTPLEIYVQNSENTKEPCPTLESDIMLADDNILKQMFAKTKSLTSKDDLLFKLRNNILINAAKALGCNKIFTSESSTDIAVKLVSNLTLGRGAQLPYDVAFCDTRDSNIKVLRPMRDISAKEIGFYNFFHNLQSVFVPTFSTMAESPSSLQKLTEQFVINLQVSFPATVSTIFRTGEKLSAKQYDRSDEETCPLCNAPLDTSSVPSSSLSATNFSSKISSLGPREFHSKTPTQPCQDIQFCGQKHINQSNQSACSCSEEQVMTLTLEGLRDILCYGCTLIVKEMDLNTLPRQITKLLLEKISTHNMRTEISDFLL